MARDPRRARRRGGRIAGAGAPTRGVPARAALLPLGLAALFLLQGIAGNLAKSLTYDEPTYIGGGWAIAAWDDYTVFPQAPPLTQLMAASPLLLGTPPQVEANGGWRGAGNPKLQLGWDVLYRGSGDVRLIAFWARLPNLVLGASLVLVAYGWIARLAGRPAGLLAAAATAFSPDLLAHAKVASADLGCALFMVGAVASLERAFRAPNPLRLEPWVLVGLSTGLALATKFTALLLGPIFALLVLYEIVAGRVPLSLRRLAARLALAAGLAAAVVSLSYRGQGELLGLAHYWDGVRALYDDHRAQAWFYLLGETSTEPWWYYHLAALAMKMPLGSIGLAGIGLLVLSRGPERGRRTAYLLVAPLVVLLASCFDEANIGVRRVLPAEAFLLLLAGMALADRPSRRRSGLGAVLVGATVVASLSVFPHHLAFFNRAVGGPERGPALLADSNLDWGQDLPGLAAWQLGRPPGEVVKLAYFGTAFAPAWGVRAVEMPEADVAAPSPGVYAVSVTRLVGFRRAGHPAWLESHRPIAKAGHSIHVFEFPPR